MADPIYKSKDGQTVTKQDLLRSGYSESDIQSGLKKGILTQVGDTNAKGGISAFANAAAAAAPATKYKSKDGQVVTHSDLIQSGYSEDDINNGLSDGILSPINSAPKKKESTGGATSSGQIAASLSQSTAPSSPSLLAPPKQGSGSFNDITNNNIMAQGQDEPAPAPVTNGKPKGFTEKLLNIDAAPLKVTLGGKEFAISPPANMVMGREAWAAGVKQRIESGHPAPQDISHLAKTHGLSDEVITAYMKSPLDGATAEAGFKATKTENELSSALDQIQPYYAKAETSELLNDRERALDFLEHYESMQPPAKRQFEVGNRGELRDESDESYNARPDVQAYKKQQSLFQTIAPTMRKRVVERQVDGFFSDEMSKDEAINQTARGLDRKMYNEANAALSVKSNNFMRKGFDAFMEATGGENSDEKDIKLSKTVLGQGEVAFNNSLLERGAQLLYEARKKGDKEAEARIIKKMQQYDPNAVYKYPTVVESNLTNEASNYLAEVAGNKEETSTESWSLKLFNDPTAKVKYTRRLFEEKGYFDKPETKEIANKILADIMLGTDKIASTAIVTTAFEGFAQPFFDAVKTVGDLTGIRNDKAITAERISDRLFPKEVGGLKENISTIRNIVNTTGNVLGQAAFQYLTAGAGRAMGMAQGAARATGFWVSGAAPAFDTAYKESFDLTENTAARLLYATAIATATGATEKIFQDVKLLEFPAVKQAVANYARRAATEGFSRELQQEATDGFIKGALEYGKAYGKNMGQEVVEEVATSVFTDVTKMVYGDENTDVASMLKNAKETAIQTAVGTSLIGMYGGYKDIQKQKNSMFRSAVYNAGVFHDEAEDVINKGFAEGLYDKNERDLKLASVNTARAEIAKLDKAEAALGREPLTLQQRQVYVANRTAEHLLQKELDATTDDNIKDDISKRLELLKKQRERIFVDDVQFDESLMEVTTTVVPATETAPATTITTTPAKMAEASEAAPASDAAPATAAVVAPLEDEDDDGIPKAAGTVGSVINRRVSYNGEEADVYVEGKTVVAEVPASEGKPARIHEIGNVDEVATQGIDAFGIKEVEQKVVSNEDGTISVNGNRYSPQAVDVKYGADGNVSRVTLLNDKGRRRKFGGQLAEDIAYQSRLNEFNNDPTRRAELEDFINADEATRTEIESANNGAVAETAEGAATPNTGAVSSTQAPTEVGEANLPSLDIPVASQEATAAAETLQEGGTITQPEQAETAPPTSNGATAPKKGMTKEDAKSLLDDEDFSEEEEDGADSEASSPNVREYTSSSIRDADKDAKAIGGKLGRLIGDAARILRVNKKARITIHEGKGSYARALARFSDDTQGSETNGFFISNNGDEIHINAEVANDPSVNAREVVFHEGAHPLLDALAEKSPEVIDRLHSELQELAEYALLAKEALDFAENGFYDDPVQAKKEAIVQFMALVADNTRSIPVSALSRIKTFIDNVINAIGLPPMFSKTITDKDSIVNVAKKFTEAIAHGRQIDVRYTSVASMRVTGNETPDQPLQLSSTKGKREGFSRLPSYGSITQAPLSSFKGEDMVITGADRLTTGEQRLSNGEIVRLLGGWAYPSETGKVWATAGKGQANRIVELLNRQIKEVGRGLLGIRAMTEGAVTSNYSFFNAAINEMQAGLQAKNFSKKELIEKINDTFKLAELAKMDKPKINSRTSEEQIAQLLLEFFNTDKSTFEARSAFVRSFLGGFDTKKDSQWGGLPSSRVLAQKINDPVLDGVRAQSLVAVISIDKPVSMRVTDAKTDGEMFHNSYPVVVESEATPKVILLDGAYNIEDVVPKFKNDGNVAHITRDDYERRGLPIAKGNTSYVNKYTGGAANVTRKVAVETKAAPAVQFSASKRVAGKHQGINIHEETSPESFQAALKAAVDNRPADGRSVDVKSVSDYQEVLNEGGKLFLSEDGMFGAMILPNGYMGSLFRNPNSKTKGVSTSLLAIGVEQGAYFFDAYGTHLEDIYIKNGFRPVARVPFNEDLVDEGWDAADSVLRNKPDLVFFSYDPSSSYKKGDGAYFEDWLKAYTFAKQYNSDDRGRKTEGTAFGQLGDANVPNGEQAAQRTAAGRAAERADNQGNNGRPSGEQGRSGSNIQQSPVNNSTTTQTFFSETVKGSNQPLAAWKPLKPFNGKLQDVYNIWKGFKGKFDNHIDTNIPAFRDTQVRVMSAIASVYNGAANVIDIGGSEGGFAKTLTTLNPKIKSTNLDLNTDMKTAHEATPVEGAEFVRGAFGEDVDMGDEVVKRYIPAEKADVVHEAMVFQFIRPDRIGFVNEVAENFLKEDGVFLTEEKVIAENWSQNELKKDNDFKSHYYTSQAVREKQEKVVTGMKGNQAREEHLLQALTNNFKYVTQYWDSGNFKGYAASNNKAALDKLVGAIGDTTTDYTSRDNMVRYEDGFYASAPQDIVPKTVNSELSSLKDEYNKTNNVTTEQVPLHKLNETFFKEIADFHDETADDRNNPEVIASYRAFMDETKKMYYALVEAGYKIEPYLGEGEPYGVSSSAVIADIRDNKHLSYLMSRSATGDGNENLDAKEYILFEPTGIKLKGQEVVYNDLFRAVHDIFGHGMLGNKFSAQGEFQAYLTHSNMYSEAAQKALFLETVTYNAWYNFGAQLRRKDGTVPKKGEEGYVPTEQRNYAPRKLYNIPSEWVDQARKKPQFSAAAREVRDAVSRMNYKEQGALLATMPYVYDHQDENAERIISDKNLWKGEGANVWRYKFENIGDVFRELTKYNNTFLDSGYIYEKINMLQRFINEQLKGGIHPDDKYSTVKRQNGKVIEDLKNAYLNQPSFSELQDRVLQAAISLIDGDLAAAKEGVDYFDKFRKEDSPADAIRAENRLKAGLIAAKYERGTLSPDTKEVLIDLMRTKDARFSPSEVEEKKVQFSKTTLPHVNTVFETRDGLPIGFNYDTNKVARERFDLSKLKRLSAGSDRVVFDLGDKVLKVAKTARGLEQNVHEGSWDLVMEGILPKVHESGLNYIVAEKVTPAKRTGAVVVADSTGSKFTIASLNQGYQTGTTGSFETKEEAQKVLDKKLDKGNQRVAEVLHDLSGFTQRDFDNKDYRLQDALEKHGLNYILNYEVLWGDFQRPANWGIKEGKPIHLDGGTFGGVAMIMNYRGVKNMEDADFREVFLRSKAKKKEYMDNDKYAQFSKSKPAPKVPNIPSGNVPATKEGLSTSIYRNILSVTDSQYDFRIDTIPLTQEQREKAVADIFEGKQTKRSATLLEAIERMWEEGFIYFNRGRGNHTEYVQIPVEEYFNLINDPIDYEEINAMLAEEAWDAPQFSGHINKVVAKVADALEADPNNEIPVREALMDKYKNNANRVDKIIQLAKDLLSVPTSSIRNQTIAEKRAALGVDGAIGKNVRTDLEVEAAADQAIADGMNYQELIDDILENKDQANDIEIVIMGKYAALLESRLRKANKEVEAMKDAPLFKAEHDRLSAERDDILRKLNDVYNASRLSGSETARALRIRRMHRLEDDSLAGMFAREMEVQKVSKLTKESIETVMQEYEQIKEAKEALEKRIRQLAEKDAQVAAAEELERTRKKTVRAKNKSADEFKEDRKNILDRIKDKLNKKKPPQASANANTPAPQPKATRSEVPAEELTAIRGDIKDLMASFVAEGVTDSNQILDNIHDLLKDEVNGITKNNIRDVLAGRYNPPKKTRDELGEDIAVMRQQMELLTKLDELKSGEKPKTEKAQKKYNREIAHLKGLIHNLRAEERKAEAEAKKVTLLEIELERVKNREAAAKKDPVQKKQLSERAQELKEQIKAEKEKWNEEVSLAKLENELQRVRNRAAKIVKPQNKRALTDREKELVKQIKAERALWAKERAKSPDRALKALKSRMTTQINDITIRLAAGDYSTPQRTPVHLDAEAVRLQKELEELRTQRVVRQAQEEFEKRGRLKKGYDLMLAPFLESRAIVASMDYSAPLRQGVIPTIAELVTNPVKAGRRMAMMFKASATSDYFKTHMAQLKMTPMYKVMMDSGLAITDPYGALTSKEEVFQSRYLEKIPVIGTNMMRGSERAYAMYLNSQRVDMFVKGADLMFAKGMTPETHPQEYKRWANTVNTLTGRGQLIGDLAKASDFLSFSFFSPRLIAARLALFNPVFYARIPAPARKMVLGDLAKFLGFVTVVLASLKYFFEEDEEETIAKLNGEDRARYDKLVAALEKAKRGKSEKQVEIKQATLDGFVYSKRSGLSVELDPRSSDFAKVRIGSTRYDLLGGLQQYVVLASRVIMQGTKKTTTGAVVPFGRGMGNQTTGDAFVSFFRNKTSPLVSSGISLMQGEDALGNEFGYWDAVRSITAPLVAVDTYEAIRDNGISGMVTHTVPAVFGVSVAEHSNKVADLYDIPTFGEKKVERMKEAGIDDVKELQQALKDDKLKDMKYEDDEGKKKPLFTKKDLKNIEEAMKNIQK